MFKVDVQWLGILRWTTHNRQIYKDNGKKNLNGVETPNLKVKLCISKLYHFVGSAIQRLQPNMHKI
jgi:hypothetical protein